MKHLVTLVVCLFLFTNSALSFQGATPAPSKKQPAAKKEVIDCASVNDTTLTATVKDKLANTPSLKDATINVTAKDGTITLTGSVKKPTNKGLATLQAKRVSCVKKIDNQLIVESSSAGEKKTKT
jgi:osmotically-inducible protein OsmY